MGKIMAEVLCMLAIATKEMKEKRTSEFIPTLNFLLLNLEQKRF